MKKSFSFEDKKAKYSLQQDGRFVIENYNFSRPFCSFFPGIAGLYGIPMWVFYVNRCQCISSFGINSKDHPIVEFQPANKAYQMIFQNGFRSFLKIKNKSRNIFYEPFQNNFNNFGFKTTNKMTIDFSELTIEENNLTLGIQIELSYFTIPSDNFAALVRIFTIRNNTTTTRGIELLDGLPIFIPYGITNMFLKKLSRTIEAWMRVENLENSVPFYRLPVDPTDRPEVIHIKRGNFYLGFYEKGKPSLIKPIVDPDFIFGNIKDLSLPYSFLTQENFRYPRKQITQSKTPCAFSFVSFDLEKNSEFTLYSVMGNMDSKEKLNNSIKRIANRDYICSKRQELKDIISKITNNALTISSSLAFNYYVQGTFMDNVLRGGLPTTIDRQKNEVIYVFSRKHGDLERDYNKFVTQPTYFSQGDGNYRDVNQNRRNDVFFNPDLKDNNIIAFFNLIQLDGFNPLVIKGIRYHFENQTNFEQILQTYARKEHRDILSNFLSQPFHIGELFLFLEENEITIENIQGFIQDVLSFSIAEQDAEHKEGFWTDHWTYNTDLLERYLCVYPEELKNILLEKKEFSFYDNYAVVNPRSKKYVLYHGKPRQLNSVSFVEEKRKLIYSRTIEPHKVRKENGKGQILFTNLLVKLICIIVNKLASLDPFGVGIEMESDKPDWYDALNGLPALFGSSVNETMELQRLITFVKKSLQEDLCLPADFSIDIPEEIYDFLQGLEKLLVEESEEDTFSFWDKSYSLKEEYRNRVIFGVSGIDKKIQIDKILNFFEKALTKLERGICKAFNSEKKYYWTYFINEVVEYDLLDRPDSAQKNNNHEPIYISPRKFRQRPLPLFLEGFVHAFRIAKNQSEKKSLYLAVKGSTLYDKKLKMYKVNASLKDQPEEIGRAKAFTPGWLENESIWLHMEYKYLLELLKSGLYEEFYEEFFKVAIPFQKPQRYGRSILENSSFIVSSVFPDEKIHGNGFVARLSGSTAELIHIWLVINVGLKPFFLDHKGQLALKFCPLLHKELFTKKSQHIFLNGWQEKETSLVVEKNCYAFMFFGKTIVIYHNPKRLHTFGSKAATVKKIVLIAKEGDVQEINSDVLDMVNARRVREGFFSRIDIYLS